MPSEFGDGRTVKPGYDQLGILNNNPPAAAEHLPCPRCESSNTKFCYYNNYNLSQPRHFCKSCRRYWTQGGTLRNIPVGGGTRKNPSKRSRTSSSSTTTSSSSCSSANHDPAVLAIPISISNQVNPETDSPLKSSSNPNENISGGGFSALLNGNGPAGFLALGGLGYGLGVGAGYDEMGYGLTRGLWTYPEVGETGGNNGGNVVGCVGGGGPDASVAASAGCNTFPLNGNVVVDGGGGGGGGWSDVDYFGWPDLAISMPGNGMK